MTRHFLLAEPACRLDRLGGMTMGWPEPQDSRSSVRKAGERIRKAQPHLGDFAVLNRWRAAHGYIINTFQATFRNRTKGTHVQVAQRLKRATTIIDKLRQGRAVDLSTMHDIAGVRLVFPDLASMHELRAKTHQSRAKHLMTNGEDKYDYLQAPKGSGYRGIHDIYRYQAGSFSGSKWNGLLIEIQYRTLIQHAWATAVELSDVLTKNRTKFSQGAPENERFFQICSELLSRRYEESVSCLPSLSKPELVDEWRDIEQRSHLFQQLRSAGSQESGAYLAGFVLLIVHPEGDLKVERQKSYREAISRLLALEEDHPEWDIVLVQGGDESLKSAFRNYFRNATEFIRLMEGAL